MVIDWMALANSLDNDGAIIRRGVQRRHKQAEALQARGIETDMWASTADAIASRLAEIAARAIRAGLGPRELEMTNDQAPDTPAPEPVRGGEATGRAKGGKARAASLTPERRKEIAQKAAQTRWRKA